MPSSTRKQRIDFAIIGAGTLATALAVALHQNGYRISEIIARDRAKSLRRARALAKRVGARSTALSKAQPTATIVWVCVPDDAISTIGEKLSDRGTWEGRIVLHSSGALASDVFLPLQRAGAGIASAHPLMTFVTGAATNLQAVPFAIEGDSKAVSLIAGVLRSLGAKPFRIASQYKPAYHAFGFFSSPALVALVVSAQRVGRLAGLSDRRARELMEPIVRRTLDNCFRTTPQKAFSGPLRRGDVATIRKHIEVLKQESALLELYRALIEVALQELPVTRMDELRRVIG